VDIESDWILERVDVGGGEDGTVAFRLNENLALTGLCCNIDSSKAFNC
jgi:hypothetical protein